MSEYINGIIEKINECENSIKDNNNDENIIEEFEKLRKYIKDTPLPQTRIKKAESEVDISSPLVRRSVIESKSKLPDEVEAEPDAPKGKRTDPFLKLTVLAARKLKKKCNVYCQVQVLFNDKVVYEETTPVIQKTDNPEWHQQIAIPDDLIQKARLSKLRFEIREKKTLLGDSSLGQCTLELGENVPDGKASEFQTGTWVEVKGEKKNAGGEVLLSIDYLSARHAKIISQGFE